MERKKTEETKGDQIAKKLEEDILSGILTEGSPVPSQGETAKRFNVSTRSVREAYKVLEAKGLIESSQGRCARVKSVTLPGVLDLIREKEKMSEQRLMKEKFSFFLKAERNALEKAMRKRSIDERLTGNELFGVDVPYLLSWHTALLEMADDAITEALVKEGLRDHVKTLEKVFRKGKEPILELSKRMVDAVSGRDVMMALSLFTVFEEEAKKKAF